jgi:hypothetical protein
MILVTILDFVRCLKRDEIVKKEIDAWMFSGFGELSRFVRDKQDKGIKLTDEEKKGLRELDEILTKYNLPKIFWSSYGNDRE